MTATTDDANFYLSITDTDTDTSKPAAHNVGMIW